MKAVSQQSIAEISSSVPWSRKLYNSAEELWQDSKELHHWYIVWRTLDGWYEDFKPDSVFYVGRSPAAYLKNVEKIDENDIRKWQRFLWNQAVVPMLIVKSGTQIRVYTAYTQPLKPNSTERVLSLLEVTADALELDRLWTKIEAGSIYETNSKLFDRTHAVDRFLLENINEAANQLSETQTGGKNEKNLEFVHQFLTRLLFVCYLTERGMIKGEHFNYEPLKKLKPVTKNDEGYSFSRLFNDLQRNTEKKEVLCRIFAQVKDRFNGSLFPETIAQEKDKYNENFIEIVGAFLRGDDLKTRQSSLFYWPYDFRVIPIEIISSIYESFLCSQGKTKEEHGEANSQKTTGSYYTPLHLAELVVDIALKDIKTPVHKLKVLDPACGSGVFLVSLFGRMAESLRVAEGYIGNKRCIDWARKVSLLLKQLYGVDIKNTACHITCFSLYLALLEQLEPMDVEYLRNHNENKKAFQPLLAEDNKGYHTIHHDNLFNPKLSLKERGFDVVIGNPPWVSRQHQKDDVFLEWLASKEINVYGPEKQIAHGFMWETPKYLLESGTACLLLPASVLLNEHTNQFQKEWFKFVTVENVINFSDLRYILFENAIRPCVAIRFRPLKSNPENIIRYESPKTDIRSQKGGNVYIREEDTVSVSVKDVVYTAREKIAPSFWKSHYWGTWRDVRLLGRLSDLPRLNHYLDSKRFIKGQGFQIFNPKPSSDISKIMKKKKPEKPWWSNTQAFLPVRKMTDLVVVPTVFEPIGDRFRRLLFPRDPKIFEGPKLLISQGSQNMKVAFCNYSVIFQSALQTITGIEKNAADILRFLSVVIKSDVVQYYLFHTSANRGIERDKVLFYELLSVPFFLPEDATDKKTAQKIIVDVASKVKGFEKELEKEDYFLNDYEKQAQEIRIELEPLIRKYYDIDDYESMLIDDTLNLAVESFHPRECKLNIPTLADVNEPQAKEYTKTLCEMLNNFGKGKAFKVNGEIIKGQPYSIVQLSLTNKIKQEIPISTANSKLAKIFERMKLLLQKKSGRFVFCQNLKVFDANDLYILKPMQMRFWSRTAALNDADEIAGAILSSRLGK